MSESTQRGGQGLKRATCPTCIGHGFQVRQDYDRIDGVRVHFNAGSFEVESPVEKGERFSVDATAMLVDGSRPDGGGVAVFRVRDTYQPCDVCNGFRTVPKAYVVRDVLDRSRGVARALFIALVLALGACRAPAPVNQWHFELSGGELVAVAGAPERIHGARRAGGVPPTPPAWLAPYDLVAWRELLRQAWERR